MVAHDDGASAREEVVRTMEDSGCSPISLSLRPPLSLHPVSAPGPGVMPPYLHGGGDK
jgi:hypothetical protein